MSLLNRARSVEIPRDIKLGLALGGGSVRGLAHLGVLKVIQELDLSIHFIAGTSIGAMLGALYAEGAPLKEIITIARHIKWFDIYAWSFTSSGLSSSIAIENLIRRFIPHDSFKRLSTPFAVTVSNLTTGELEIRTTGSISQAVRMSATFPGFYAPVESHGQLFVDGGVFCNLPTDVVYDMGANIAIGVDVLPKAVFPKKNAPLFEVLDRSLDLLMQSQGRKYREDLVLRPVQNFVGSLDMSRKSELIECGEKNARKHLIPFLKKIHVL